MFFVVGFLVVFVWFCCCCCLWGGCFFLKAKQKKITLLLCLFWQTPLWRKGGVFRLIHIMDWAWTQKPENLPRAHTQPSKTNPQGWSCHGQSSAPHGAGRAAHSPCSCPPQLAAPVPPQPAPPTSNTGTLAASSLSVLSMPFDCQLSSIIISPAASIVPD